MPSYRLSPLAENDLEDIWLYTVDRWSLNQADKYFGEIIAVIEKLASGEKRGRDADIRDGYLKYAVGRHFVFYRVSDIGIDVIRILHQSMDVDLHL